MPVEYECRRTTGTPCPTFIAITALAADADADAVDTSGIGPNPDTSSSWPSATPKLPPPIMAGDERSLDIAIAAGVEEEEESARLAEAERKVRQGGDTDPECVSRSPAAAPPSSSRGALEIATAAA